MKLKQIVILIFSLLCGFTSQAQDPQLTQSFASPLYLSPSFAGSTTGTRAVLNFRDQWPAIPGSFITYLMSIDHNLYKYNSGIGLLFLRDQAGSGHLSTTNFGFQYSYNIVVNKKFSIRPGMYFYYSQRSIDFSRLVFNDQVDLDENNPSSVEIPTFKKTGFLDYTVSAIGFTRQYWGGFQIAHLLKPNESLRQEGISELPTTYYLMGGGKVALNGKIGKANEESLQFSFVYKSQQKFDQLDIGAYWYKRPLVIGLWYRGIPIFKHYDRGYANNDALAVMVGYQAEDWKIGYSYDFTISRLAMKSAGAHEISLIYEFNKNQKITEKSKKVIIPCSKF
ncbi:MAG: type IX secretion system membrane protein PorP/SprF [Bacteroidales bacterium]|nr:type IX secretion system membrane protein PorP/SprF [Bacteroidales bacterium]